MNEVSCDITIARDLEKIEIKIKTFSLYLNFIFK